MAEEEYLKIIDENNNLTGRDQPRSLAHKNGLWHRVVYIYFFRREGQLLYFLANLRSVYKDTDPGKWATWLGGHVKSGQDELQAAVTEMSEEIGFEIEPVDLIDGGWRKLEKFPNNKEFHKILFYEFNGDLSELKFKDKEVQKVVWMSVDSIEQNMSVQPDKWVGTETLSDFIKTVSILRENLIKKANI